MCYKVDYNSEEITKEETKNKCIAVLFHNLHKTEIREKQIFTCKCYLYFITTVFKNIKVQPFH